MTDNLKFHPGAVGKRPRQPDGMAAWLQPDTRKEHGNTLEPERRGNRAGELPGHRSGMRSAREAPRARMACGAAAHHTTADPRIADTLVFRHDAVASGLKALRSGAPIFCDSKMIRSGLSLARLRRLNPGYGPNGCTAILTTRTFWHGQRRKAAHAPCAARKKPALYSTGHRPHRQCPARAGPHRPLRAGRKCAPCPRRRNARGVRQCRRVQGPPCPLRRPPDCP